ncbi:hypothetical protein P22_1090 [Propionispora sp. 2/2-37]|uniref:glycosyltransferase family 9 protein n=1 Tax=Propionispora sp. 2/2-37 TaxID=1677858 RepID=UPI0006BB765D|nr:glycosyltransferase family 9 protein [Propionispora sp. 2/2-37]CUH95021.1 hypothetical protein P22_1090 [Propionispora sp. 2/2-37]
MEKEILIIRLSSIGDVIHCTPVARTLKAAWPHCRITWMVGETAADLLKNSPYVDEVIMWSRERFERHIRKLEFTKALRMWRELQKILANREFDAVLDIHGLFLSGMIARQAKAKRRIGLAGARELNPLFMTETALPLGKQVTEKYLGVVKALGINEFDFRMHLALTAENREFAKQYLAKEGILPQERFAVIIPGTTWQSKNWPIDFFCKTIKRLRRDFKIVLGGGKAEAALGMEIEKSCAPGISNAIGKTGLLDMAGIIEQAAIVVTGDTGPLHIAAALGVPTVSVFGPTDPEVYAPVGGDNIVLFHKLGCSFCHKMVCPDGHNMCMYSVAPEDVIEAVYRLTR